MQLKSFISKRIVLWREISFWGQSVQIFLSKLFIFFVLHKYSYFYFSTEWKYTCNPRLLAGRSSSLKTTPHITSSFHRFLSYVAPWFDTSSSTRSSLIKFLGRFKQFLMKEMNSKDKLHQDSSNACNKLHLNAGVFLHKGLAGWRRPNSDQRWP